MASITHAYVATGSDAGNGEVRKAQWNADHVFDGIPYVLAQSGAAVSVGAVVTETALATITIPANALGPNGFVTVLNSWTVTNNANNKDLRVRLGGIAGTQVAGQTVTTNVAMGRQTTILNANSTSAQKAFAPPFLPAGLGLATAALVTTTIDTTAAWDIVLSGQKASAGDTLTLESYQVIISYGA